jgi:hypothetical protein
MMAATASTVRSRLPRWATNGMSPTMNFSGAPRRTAATWSAINSGVAASVSACPCIVIATESPTRMQSMLDRATSFAIVES